eukprot:10920915-Lingulodinium_polyedra.AAC.1
MYISRRWPRAALGAATPRWASAPCAHCNGAAAQNALGDLAAAPAATERLLREQPCTCRASAPPLAP